MEQHIEVLQKLGKLAKLEVSETDEKLKEDFKKIVEYMNVIREVDTTGIQPLSHMQFVKLGEKEHTFASALNTGRTWESPAGPVWRLGASTDLGLGSITGQGTKSPQVSRCGQKKTQKETSRIQKKKKKKVKSAEGRTHADTGTHSEEAT